MLAGNRSDRQSAVASEPTDAPEKARYCPQKNGGGRSSAGAAWLTFGTVDSSPSCRRGPSDSSSEIDRLRKLTVAPPFKAPALGPRLCGYDEHTGGGSRSMSRGCQCSRTTPVASPCRPGRTTSRTAVREGEHPATSGLGRGKRDEALGPRLQGRRAHGWRPTIRAPRLPVRSHDACGEPLPAKRDTSRIVLREGGHPVASGLGCGKRDEALGPRLHGDDEHMGDGPRYVSHDCGCGRTTIAASPCRPGGNTSPGRSRRLPAAIRVPANGDAAARRPACRCASAARRVRAAHKRGRGDPHAPGSRWPGR